VIQSARARISPNVLDVASLLPTSSKEGTLPTPTKQLLFLLFITAPSHLPRLPINFPTALAAVDVYFQYLKPVYTFRPYVIFSSSNRRKLNLEEYVINALIITNTMVLSSRVLESMNIYLRHSKIYTMLKKVL
jgi:hypothetical protein